MTVRHNIDLENASYIDLSLLNSISDTLTSSLNLKDTLSKIFETFHDHMGITRGIITLKDTHTTNLHIEMAYGLTEDEKKRELNRVNNVIRKKVLETGEPIIVANLKEEPSIMDTIGPRKKTDRISYICLPIILGEERIGTLGVDCPFKDDPTLTKHVKVLSVFTLMIGQEIKLKNLMESEKEALLNENIQLKEELKEKYNIDNMIGNSSAMHQVYEYIMQVAKSNATVLIRGESGTGKELVAHAIHYNSPRASNPFIKINCGAIPESLIETELFGHEKGSFTDAIEQKIGKFEAADGGTIFMDEIGELSPAIQVKLLRVLQEKEIDRIGSINPIKINVRVITATNRDLEKELNENRFRQDLYYRLNVFPIYIPPLRERRTDILLLAEHFLDRFANENNKKIKRISALAIDLINSYHWPGNVRELENCIERAALVCNSDTIQASNLPPTLQRTNSTYSEKENLTLREQVENYEKEIILDALKKSRGNKSKAAKMLGTTQRIIGYKIELLNINYLKPI
jgi:Nif-specific regulatory protein